MEQSAVPRAGGNSIFLLTCIRSYFKVESYFKRKEQGLLKGIELSNSLSIIERKLGHLEILANLRDRGDRFKDSRKEEESTKRKVEPGLNIETHQVFLSSGAEASVRVIKDETGRSWVLGKDVSALVPEWRGYDLFANRLKAKGLEPVTRRLLEKDEGFEDIRRSGLVGESEEEVLLYLLENLSVILTQINPKAGLALSKLCYSTRRG